MQRLASPPPQSVEAPKKNRIQVSNTKKPLFFYVNLAKRPMPLFKEVVEIVKADAIVQRNCFLAEAKLNEIVDVF
ncbi:hypothetical protein DVH24_003500 [Malus domestica]|uniref:Uncharacterized protein n=1 Tax=Malus domestica TaxID=3750 RepID=A0A498IM02_MALDO|nr:hypothetical protein DVH24_003500 [Malus domestica]